MSNRNLLRTEYRTPTHANLKIRLGYEPLLQSDRVHNDAMLLKKYERRFVKTDYKNNKVVQIDDRTGQPYNQKEAVKYINLNKYGTETPDKDYAYLERKRQLDARETRIDKSEEHGPLGFRKALSRKTDSGSTIVEGQHQTHVDKRRSKLAKERAKLAILKEGTSFDKPTEEEIKEQNQKLLPKAKVEKVNGETKINLNKIRIPNYDE